MLHQYASTLPYFALDLHQQSISEHWLLFEMILIGLFLQSLRRFFRSMLILTIMH